MGSGHIQSPKLRQQMKNIILSIFLLVSCTPKEKEMASELIKEAEIIDYQVNEDVERYQSNHSISVHQDPPQCS